MRLKQNVVMILILLLLLSSLTLGMFFTGKKQPEIIEDIPEEVIDVIPDTFCKNIVNGENIPADVLKVVTDYMDDYFLSMYTLELVDTSKYFTNEIDQKISNNAIKLTVESRKLYDFDFTMSDAHYVLNITNSSNIDGKYYIDFLEDDYMCFKFLNGISSEAYDIENSIVLEKVNDEYKISSYEKTQGYYMMFSDNRNENQDDIYSYYYERLLNTVEDEEYKRTLASSTPYYATKAFTVNYDRNAASKYAQTYYHDRNESYYDYFDEGGNCQNFASQALVAGGMLMDESGECQWYYDSYSDYTPAWVHVSSFNDYCKENEGRGLVSDTKVNIYYAEPGDLIQVGISSISHTTIVSKVIDGHILLNSNSIDMKDFPLEAYTYPVRKLIKILGSNS